jgi:hypothetical protein
LRLNETGESRFRARPIVAAIAERDGAPIVGAFRAGRVGFSLRISFAVDNFGREYLHDNDFETVKYITGTIKFVEGDLVLTANLAQRSPLIVQSCFQCFN